MNHTNNLALHRNTSGNSNKISNRKILPTTTYTRITSSSSSSSNKFMFIEPAGPVRFFKYLYRTFLDFTMIVPSSCKWLTIPSFSLSITPSIGRKVTGTLFGNRRGHVSFAVQDDPRSPPVLIVELSTSTATLVKEMSSGLVRIALECEKSPTSSAAREDNKSPSSTAARGGTRRVKLFQEPAWTMYCNGRRSGYAVTRGCSESDWHVLSTVQSVSAGAGVIPVIGGGGKSESEGELLYMRARFERVVGSRDSEAFYMMNPDGHGGPELSIFLLRL